jgi:hypothetical protein
MTLLKASSRASQGWHRGGSAVIFEKRLPIQFDGGHNQMIIGMELGADG